MTTVVSVIILDQITKIIVLNTMTKGQSIDILGRWLKLTFTENPGMAFGITFGPPALITIFSLMATVLIILYLFKVGGVYKPYRVSLSLVLGGALGNIIDRVFYGMILYDEPLFLGKVVDFIHINIWRGYVSDVVPIIGGKYLALFPIWNVADMAIVVGVAGIIFFQRHFHKQVVPEMNSAGDGENGDTNAEVALEPAVTPEAPLPGQASGEGDDSGK